jgi:hypothetical protein
LSVQESDQQGQESTEEGDFVERAKRELVRISGEVKEISSKKQERMKREEKVNKTDDKQAPEQPVVKKTEAEEVVSEKPFMLVEEGHTLTLPAKYRKMKSLNSKLISQIHKNLEETDLNHSEEFVNRLENQFDWLNEISHETVRTEAQTLMESQHKLLLHAEWVIEKSTVIGHSQSTFSWQNVYKCYRHWQVLLGQFRELQKRTQDLLAGESLCNFVFCVVFEIRK